MTKYIIAILLSFLSLSADATIYKIFIGVPAGSGADVQTRRIFEEVGKITGDTFVVFNKPGANLMIAYRAFIEEAHRDPNVILHGGSVYAVNAYLMKEHDIDPVNELKGLVLTQYISSLLVTRSDSKFDSMNSLSGKVNVGVSNPLSEYLITTEAPKNSDTQVINYKSDSESTLALLSGTVDMIETTTFNPYLKSHKESLKVIHTHEVLAGTGYAVYKTFPEQDRVKLNKALNQVLADPELVEWLKNSFTFKPVGGKPEKYDQMMIDMKKVITKHRIR
jgi:tripartite-type tricarboxylate transporter receptor subunit TctC